MIGEFHFEWRLRFKGVTRLSGIKLAEAACACPKNPSFSLKL
jgi:hypothetical protein